jgi:ribose transport system substrate-binding protein
MRFKTFLAGAMLVPLATACTTSSSQPEATDLAAADSGDASAPALAADPTMAFADFRQTKIDSTTGRTLAYVPGGMGNDAQTSWASQMEAGAEHLGMEFILRDPAWDRRAQVQATETLISQLQAGDVLVLNPQDVSLLSTQVKAAADAGIYTIILNQAASHLGDVFVGGDLLDIGRRTAEDLVEACGPETSGKISIVEGDSSGGISVLMKQGATPVFEANPDIEIVSEQNGAWDPKAASDITAVVLQQHSDLCAVWVQWDPMALAVGNAIADAGRQGEVKVFTYDALTACKAIPDGLMTATYSDSRTDQGTIIVAYADMLIQSGIKPGTSHFAHFTRTFKIDSSNASEPGLCYGSQAAG